MSPWSKRVLIATMLIWTALTLGAGWYALRGSSDSAVAADRATTSGGVSVTPRAGATNNNATPSNGTSQPSVGDAADQAATATAFAKPTPPASLQPVPAHAGSAGTAPRAGSLNPDGPRPAVAKPASKGVVVLDPGHGRGDPGAVHYVPDGSGRYDITEADSNLLNAELIRDDLVTMGYEVYLTRNGEGQGPGAPLPLQFITSDLYARVGLAKAVDADVYLAIHGNGASVPFLSGPETWYCGRHQEGAANERLASLVQQAMMDALHEYGYSPPDRGIKEDAQSHHSGDFCQFVVTRETPVPAALLEFLFLSNDDDAKVLVDDESHVLMAKHVAAAVDRFMQERAANP